MWYTFDLVFKVTLRSFIALVSKWTVTLKRRVVEQNGVNLTLGASNRYMGTCDLVVFKVILGSFGALVSKWPVQCILKTAGRS